MPLKRRDVVAPESTIINLINHTTLRRVTRIFEIQPAKPPVVPGYTSLVVDTNILLSSLSIVSSLIQNSYSTLVDPLPVIMELDSLSSNTSQLWEAARPATSTYSHIRRGKSNTSRCVLTALFKYHANPLFE